MAKDPMYKKSISVGLTLNIGNYESLRVDVMVEGDQLPGEDADELKNRLMEQAAIDLMDVTSQFKAGLEDIKNNI